MTRRTISIPTTDAASTLAVRELSFRYGERRIFEQVSFDLAPGGFLLLSGPSGAGKSTLLRVLARLLEKEHGSILLGGVADTDIPATSYRRRVAYMQQLPVMVEGSIRSNLLLSFRYGADDPPDDDALRGMMHEAGVGALGLAEDARALSVGQQQRLALLRLLLMRPEVLLLDEPTASVDADAASTLMQTVARQQARRSLAVIMVSHHQQDLEGIASRKLRLRDGRLEMVA